MYEHRRRPPYVPDPMWDLFKDLRSWFPGVVWYNCNLNGYCSAPCELYPSNYSVVREVDKLGPTDKRSGFAIGFPEARGGDFTRISQCTGRLLTAHDCPGDSRVGPHNIAEIFGTQDGQTTDGRVHGRYASSGTLRSVLHIAVNRRWAEVEYVWQSTGSVLYGEPYDDWLGREHPRIRKDR